MSASPTTSKGLLAVEHSSPRSSSPIISSQGGRFREWWGQASRDVQADFKAVGWGNASLWVMSLLFTLVPFACLLYFGIVTKSFPGPEDMVYPGYYESCLPDGTFGVDPSFNYWQISGFFQITLSFRQQLSFTQAKVVDIIWDLAVGKGGQAIMAFYSWKAFSTYVRSAMHAGSVTYSSFFVFFLESEASLRSTYRITRDLTTGRATGRALRSKLAITCIVAVMVFVLAWPTLASAMTGYTPALKPFVLDYEDNLIPYPSFEPVAYVIHDGWRLGYEGNYLVSFYEDANANGRGYSRSGAGRPATCSATDNVTMWPGCAILVAATAYTSTHGFLALDKTGNLNNIETRWMDRVIPKPALNISAFYIPGDHPYPYGLFGNKWVDPRTKQTPYAFQSEQRFMTPTGNMTYTLPHMQKNGSCQAIDNKYLWGFSLLQLFIAVLLLLFWFIAVYTMWLKGQLDLKQRYRDEAPIRFQAVLDLAEAINHELDSVGEIPGVPINRQLKRYISNQLDSGRVTLKTPLSSESRYSLRKGVLDWIKRDKWCFTLAFLFCLVPVTVLWVLPLALVAPFSLSMILVLVVGRTRRSRELISTFGLILSLVLMAVVFPALY